MNLVTDFTVSTQERGKPTVYVSVSGPLSPGAPNRWVVYTKRWFGFVRNVHHETMYLGDALFVARQIADGSYELAPEQDTVTIPRERYEALREMGLL